MQLPKCNVPQAMIIERSRKSGERRIALFVVALRSCTVIYLLLLTTNCRPHIHSAHALAIDEASARAHQAIQEQQQQQNVELAAKPLQQNPSTQQQQQQQQEADARRPIWNIAHMVNSIKELDYRLSKGANAVEADVTFSRDGVPLYTYHGPPCDCLRHCHQMEQFDEYLAYVHDIAARGDDAAVGANLTLLFLDLKLDHLDQRGKARAGLELAKSISTHLFPPVATAAAALPSHDDLTPTRQQQQQQVQSWTELSRTPERARVRLVISVNHVHDAELVNNFVHELELRNASVLLDRIGFDVGMNDELAHIEHMWRRFRAPQLHNLWQGDGYTNCLSPFYNLERLTRALAKRDSDTGYPRKVYQWTIDLHGRMREALRLGVDAIMTNHPERLVSVLRELDMAHSVRMATRADDPFARVQRGVGAGGSSRFQRSALSARNAGVDNTSGGGFWSSIVDVLSSLLAYIKEIPYLSLPTTSRLLSRSAVSRQQVSATTTTTTTTTAAPLGETLDRSLVGQDSAQEQHQFEGPKWYTSFVSNLLVSAMKIVLPVE